MKCYVMYLSHGAVVGWFTTHIVGICNKHVACAHCNILVLSRFVICDVQHRRIIVQIKNPAALHNKTWLHVKGIL